MAKIADRVLSKLLPNRRGLRVLMYHHITDAPAKDGLDVWIQDFDQHLSWAKQHSQVLAPTTPLDHDYSGKNHTLITFDDGYLDNLTLAEPVLKKHGLKAVIFIVPQFIGQNGYLSLEQLRHINQRGTFALALHSFAHLNYAQSMQHNPDDVAQDIAQGLDYFRTHGLRHLPWLAYPYGAFPKKSKPLQLALESLFKHHGITHAFRIGNRINTRQLKNPYLIERIDIKGTEDFETFKIKFAKGRCRPWV